MKGGMEGCDYADEGSPCAGRLVETAAMPTAPLPLNSRAAVQQGANGINSGGRRPLYVPPSDASTLANPASSCVAALGFERQGDTEGGRLPWAGGSARAAGNASKEEWWTK